MHSRIVLSALALTSLGTDPNLRVRIEDGVVSIKSSTRPRGVKGEFSFAQTTADGEGSVALIPAEIPAGSFTLAKLKYGWHALVAAEADATVTVEQVEAPAEQAA